jgi:hypothetical protein
MAKAVQKRKPKKTDKKQSARFIEAARSLGLDEGDLKSFEQTFKKIAPPKPRKKS